MCCPCSTLPVGWAALPAQLGTHGCQGPAREQQPLQVPAAGRGGEEPASFADSPGINVNSCGFTRCRSPRSPWRGWGVPVPEPLWRQAEGSALVTDSASPVPWHCPRHTHGNKEPSTRSVGWKSLVWAAAPQGLGQQHPEKAQPSPPPPGAHGVNPSHISSGPQDFAPCSWAGRCVATLPCCSLPAPLCCSQPAFGTTGDPQSPLREMRAAAPHTGGSARDALLWNPHHSQIPLRVCCDPWSGWVQAGSYTAPGQTWLPPATFTRLVKVCWDLAPSMIWVPSASS